MSVLSWADSYICSAHKGDNGNMHGHTWRDILVRNRTEAVWQ